MKVIENVFYDVSYVIFAGTFAIGILHTILG